MAKVRISEQYLTDIADAIRSKTNSADKLSPSSMAEQITSISTGGGGQAGGSYTVIFNNAQPDAQEIVVQEIYTPAASETVDTATGSYDFTMGQPTISFYLRTHPGYISGDVDTSSPYTFTEKAKTINIAKATLQATDGELVSLDNYTDNSPSPTILDKNHQCIFTDAAKEYLKKVRPTSMSYAFMGDDCPSDLTIINTSECTNMDSCFRQIHMSSDTINCSNWITNKVTNMNRMFFSNNSLKIIDISNADTSNVTDMENMFEGCINLTTINGIIDMKSCTDYIDMFYNCPKLTGVKIKYPPSVTDWWQTAGFTSQDQFTIVS